MFGEEKFHFGCIVLSCNPLEDAALLAASKNPQEVRIFCMPELGIDQVREIIDEAYIAKSVQTMLIIAANTYNLYAQNALLKIIEEPPQNIQFVLFCQFKSSLLPTIQSRLPCILHSKASKLKPCSFDVLDLSLERVYAFLKEIEKDSKSFVIKEEIQSLFLACIAQGIEFDEQEFGLFEEALVWEAQKERMVNIFAVLLLKILQKTKSSAKI